MRERDRHRTICWSSTSPMLVQRLWRWTSIGLVLDLCRPLWSGWGGGGVRIVLTQLFFCLLGFICCRWGVLHHFTQHLIITCVLLSSSPETLTQRRPKVASASTTVDHHWASIVSVCLFWSCIVPHLDCLSDIRHQYIP